MIRYSHTFAAGSSRTRARYARLRRLSVLALGIAIVVATVPVGGTPSPHAYFNDLVARSDHWKSYSLRDTAQLARRADGGYAHSNSAPLAVTYDPFNDSDPHAQDAAKVVIPAFQVDPINKLATSISATTTTLPLSDLKGNVTKVSTGFNAKGRQIKIGDEIIVLDTQRTPLDRSTGLVTIHERGAYGTTATAHASDAPVAIAVNSLGNQVRVPFESHDDATWLITWDAYFTDSYVNNGIGFFKAFQLSSNRAIWLEPQVNFNGGFAGFDPTAHVGTTGQLRSYNRASGNTDWSLTDGNSLGPTVTRNSPISPSMVGDAYFTLHPNRWTRWWIRIDQRANDYDLVDEWVGDEVTEPLHIYSSIPVSVRSSKGVSSIDEFYVEFNTSTDQLPPGRTTDFRDLVAYVRNVVILRNPPRDISALLVRPGASEALPRPDSPSHLRVLQSIPGH